MATQKLYWSDPFAMTFSGARARADSWTDEHGTRATLVLDRTLFYPESGGQLADTGTLSMAGRTVRVADVQIDEQGTIHHVLAEPLEPFDDDAGDVSGAVDATRRFDHMVQHTAQHALSRALVEVARAETVSSRLGASACTIDVDGALDERDLARAEDCVNSVVTSDVVVRQLFPTPDELASMRLRRAPSVDRDVRIIDIEGFDLTPCGGTHCTRTGQIGLVRVVGLEKYVVRMRDGGGPGAGSKKQGWRVTFHAGRRALDDVRAKDAVLAELARTFTCGMLDVAAAVGKLQAQLKGRTDQLSLSRGELVELLAERELAAHPPDPSGTTRVVVVRSGEGGDVSLLRTLAGRLASRPDVVAFCACRGSMQGGIAGDAGDSGRTGGETDWTLVVQRGSGTSFDCGSWLKRAAAAHGGRGGGRPERAEGRFPSGVSMRDVTGAGSG